MNRENTQDEVNTVIARRQSLRSNP